MPLSYHQLVTLREDLRTLAHIEYEEVENELLDHYAKLTEQKMAVGQDFEPASSWAWLELGSGRGLQRIQRDYEKNMRRQVAARHLEILKSYFRWPAIVTTVLIGLLLFISLPMVPEKIIVGFLYVAILVPIGVLQYAYLKCHDQQTDSKKIIWHSLGQRSGTVLNLFNILINFFFAGDASGKPPYLPVSVLVCFVTVIYVLSFLQLYGETFHYKMAR